MEKSYSLWLVPVGQVYDKFVDLISRLSKEYSTPNFEPHITLLGEEIGEEKEIIDKTSRLAALIKPYEAKLTNIDYLDEYFRCLFVRIKETSGVMGANLKAREIFNRKTDPVYMPHLSLMYGHFSPETKEKIIKEIGREFNKSFEVGSIHLFCTEGEVKAWHRVKEFMLK